MVEMPAGGPKALWRMLRRRGEARSWWIMVVTLWWKAFFFLSLVESLLENGDNRLWVRETSG
jgi:hypothetical protein